MKKSSIVALILTAVSAVVYFASLAHYAFPGESAHLLAMWNGLDAVKTTEYPLFALFAKAFGGGNLVAPIAGAIGTYLVYFLTAFYVRNSSKTEDAINHASTLGIIAGAVAAFVFMLTPAVRGSATHLDARLFDAVWALATLAILVPFLKARRVAMVYPAVLGAMTALGLTDSSLALAVSPLVLLGIVGVSMKRGEKPFGALSMYAFSFLLFFFVVIRVFGVPMGELLKHTAKDLGTTLFSGSVLTDWCVAITSAIFIVVVFACRSSFKTKPSLVTWVFHGALTLFSILAIATPLSPSSLLATSAFAPVLTSAFAAMVAGYLAAYWWFRHKTVVGVSFGVVFAFVISFASLWNLCTFDGDRGAFADKIAEKILADLGDRTWFITDGTLDDHILYVAAKQGKEINLISLQRDLDQQYLESLKTLVAEKKLGGSKNDDLLLSLELGVLPFVQDWFKYDPTVATEVAIYGASDLWYSSGFKAVPEVLFFGADEKRAPDWSVWNELKTLLDAPKGWGSYRAGKGLDPVSEKKLALRRHLGLVANNRGVYLQDAGDLDGAFKMYDLVLTEIDTDNVCSLFNEVEMLGIPYAAARAKEAELNRKLNTIIADQSRRYVLWRLGSFYGYIRNPEMFVRLGLAWARSGRPGDALAQIRRAIDYVPVDKRTTLLNLMADLYAAENDREKSRRIYESVLAKDSNDHDALIGMMRMELLNGNAETALSYLERAVLNSPQEGRRAKIELSMVAMMKNDLEGARKLLKQLTEEDAKDMQSWSFLAAVLMQQYDQAKTEAEKSAILKELETAIIPEMERQTTNQNDYYILTTKAFVLMRQGQEKRREARDAFEAAARQRPGSSVAQDIVLGLDISLDDRPRAERHAREVLRNNREAPLANYVMGSLAIRRGQYREAEGYLRKAADAPQPNVLALNDLSEVLRRTDRLAEAETYIRRAIAQSPDFYILHETLAVILMDQGKDLDDAEFETRRALDLSKNEKGGVEDMRLYATLARVQVLRGDKKAARASIRKVESHSQDLTDFEKRELEEIRKSAL